MSIITYPGVQVVELPSGVRTITGVATSITAFVGRAQRGPVNVATRVQSFAEFSRIFGGLWALSTMSYAVQHFFQHGGRDAIIVRVYNGVIADGCATITLPAGGGNDLVLAASGPGVWGSSLRATVDLTTRDPTDTHLFNLTVDLLDSPGGSNVVRTESFRNVSTDTTSPRFYPTVVAQGSALVTVRTQTTGGTRPSAGTVNAVAGSAGDGGVVTDTNLLGTQAARTGMFALDGVDLFNLLCIPPRDWDNDLLAATWGSAATYCQSRRAMLIVDPPAAWTANPSTAVATAVTGIGTIRTAIGNDASRNAAVYFPRLRAPDPQQENRIEDFAPCGAVAGIMARTDAQRGVWKAPAGLDASFSGVSEFTYMLTDDENGELNPLGLNCLRYFAVGGNVVWGARTAAGADQLASEWKYLPVRRTALYLEESLYRGTQWVVFEPNDDPLWAQIRLNVGAFLHQLFLKGAFQGTSPKDAYFVKCDRETTTQNDINLGVVNILVGFAPLKPAEFVILQIQQIAGQIQT